MKPDLDVWVIKVRTDVDEEPEFAEMSRAAAVGMVQGFIGGGSPVVPINGGVRITTPLGYWDVILKESLEYDFRYTGQKEQA